jgi:O-antigen/teichoic acid export membrane protein
MKALRRVVGNTVISLFGQAITWASTFVLTIAYGRFLGDVQFGELYFALTFVSLIGFPIEFGFNQQLTRDIAQQPEKSRRYVSNTLFLKVLFWLPFYGVLVLLCWGLGYAGEQRLLVEICGLTLLSTAITNTFAAIYYAHERVIFPVVGTMLEKGLGAVVGFILLKLGYSIEVMALVLLGASLANSLWQAVWYFRSVGVHFTLERAVMRQLLRTSIPFLLYGVLGVIYYRVDTVLLSLSDQRRCCWLVWRWVSPL